VFLQIFSNYILALYFLPKEYLQKAACKMLVKLTTCIGHKTFGAVMSSRTMQNFFNTCLAFKKIKDHLFESLMPLSYNELNISKILHLLLKSITGAARLFSGGPNFIEILYCGPQKKFLPYFFLHKDVN
jgi:hypothetical protein